MIRLLFIFFTIVLLLILTAISYRPSLDSYSKYFNLNKNTQSSYKATFLGASSLLISDGNTHILIDGFITRPNIYALLFTKIKPNNKLIQNTLKKLNIKKLDLIIALHSHHDHVMDSALVAIQTDAVLLGSQSTANIAKSVGFEKTEILRGKTSIKVGEFFLTAIPSLHTRMSEKIEAIIGIGEKVTGEFKSPSYFTSYKEDSTYSLFIEHKKGNVFINGSTNFVKGALKNYRANTVFLGIAKLGKTQKDFQHEYFDELVLSLKAKRVIPIHWDDFTKNINDKTIPMPFIVDNFDLSMEFLIEQTQKNNISLDLMGIFDSIALDK